MNNIWRRNMAKKNKNKQASQLQSVLYSLLYANKEIMKFHLLNCDDPKLKKILRKSIKQSEKAIQIVYTIKHIEILTSLYNTFVYRKENYFVTIGAVICKSVDKWDKTEKGFKEFLELEEEAKEMALAQEKITLEKRKKIEDARKEGKKIEMVFKNGHLEPVVVEEKH